MAGTVGPYNAGHRDGRRVTSRRPWLSVCLPHLHITHSRDLGSSFQIPLISLHNTPPTSAPVRACMPSLPLAQLQTMQGFLGGREGGREEDTKEKDRLMLGGGAV